MTTLSERAKQGYERRLDGPVGAGRYSPACPSSSRARATERAFMVFWDKLAADKQVRLATLGRWSSSTARARPCRPEMARLLCEAGKPVVAWAELERPRSSSGCGEGRCAALVLYPDDPDRHNLEAALSAMCSLQALAAGMQLIAEDARLQLGGAARSICSAAAPRRSPSSARR